MSSLLILNLTKNTILSDNLHLTTIHEDVCGVSVACFPTHAEFTKGKTNYLLLSFKSVKHHIFAMTVNKLTKESNYYVKKQCS